jgi:2-polyprenyl-3-methyl-5-hydroxy-6-metoxy-1,4-benzoquinol methylase
MTKIIQFLNPNTSRYWDRKYREKIENPRIKSDGRHLHKFMPVFNRSTIILDFGAGLGGNVKYLSELLNHRQFHLVDHSQISLRYVREDLLGSEDGRGNQFVYHEDLSSVAEGSVDLVISIEVLEHITSYRKVLDRLWNRLRDGGILLISVPVKGFRDRNREHVNKFTVSSMFRILSRYGEIVHIAPRTYSKRSGKLSTAYFYVEKEHIHHQRQGTRG